MSDDTGDPTATKKRKNSRKAVQAAGEPPAEPRIRGKRRAELNARVVQDLDALRRSVDEMAEHYRVRVGGQLGAHHEQLALQPQRQVGQAGAIGAQRGSRQAQGGDGLVGGAVGIGPQVGLADPGATVEQPGRAGVALAGVDAHGPMVAAARTGRVAAPSGRPAA